MTATTSKAAHATRMKPFAQWPPATDAMRRAIISVLEGGHWWQSGGGKSEELEAWLADYHRCVGAVAVSNGTHALELSLRALGIGPGDDVLVPALTFISTASAATLVGARPVPVDVRPDTLCLDPEDLKKQLNPRSRAVVPVHLGGIPADMSTVGEIARQAGLFVVEDCAQAIGAEWKGRRVGGLGDLGTFSFQSSKLLPAGEGGALTVRSDSDLLDRLVLLSNCGRPRGSKTYEHVLIASNHRITEFQAALVLAQVDDYDRLWAQRQAAADRLAEGIVAEQLGVPINAQPGATKTAWYTFGIRLTADLADRMTNAQLAAALAAEGIPATTVYRPYYATPAYRQLLDELRPRCPNAERAAREVILLHHSLLLDQEGVSDILAALRKVAGSAR